IFTTYVDPVIKKRKSLDLNHDGRLDFIIAAFKKTLWFVPGPENPETDEWRLVKIVESTDKHGSAAIADMNRDGNPDVVWGQGWYANPGDPEKTPWERFTIDSNWTDEAQVEVADLDKDGWLDIVLTGEESDHGISWYQNPLGNDDSEWEGHIILPGYEGLHSLELADFDIDGDLDIMAAEMHHTEFRRIVLIENVDITKNEWIPRVISFSGSHKAQVADIDNDGDPDIIGKNYENDIRPRIWLNPNIKKLPMDKWNRHIIDEENASRYIIRAGDLDLDGKPDIVTGTGLYSNPGKIGDAWQRSEFGNELGTAHIVHDFDRDGDPDVFGEGFGWARNDRRGNYTLFKNIMGKGGFVQGAIAGDFSCDGSTEIVYTYKNGDGIRLIAVPQNPAVQQWTDKLLAAWDGRTKSVDGGDINRDGDVDILISGRDGSKLQWLRNNGDDRFVPVDIADPPSRINHRCRLADLNRDGRLDAVFGHKGRLLNWYEQPADLSTEWKEHIVADSTILAFDPLSLDIADMDRDGDLDIIAGEHTPKMEKLDQCRLFIFENVDGSGGKWSPHIVYKGDEHHQGTQVVDIDNDGDPDIISVGYRHSRVLLYENKAY
ncbi:hypothetical protein GF337_17110, partial [candidate division KSB1 bacterium]|nr:hypothetical protein [candidate division KSB1 bacterium]